MASSKATYRDLIVWQAAVELAVASYDYTRTFPQSELFGLTSQIRRAATSIAANIAEGHGRDSGGQFQQFLRISQGSLRELETHLIISQRIGLLSETDTGQLLTSCDEIGKMLRALIRSINAN